MSTTATFSTMLNQYLTYDLLKEEMVKRDYLFSKVEQDNGWKGGALEVPFKAAGASSISFGSLTATNDVAEDKYVRGEVSTYKEVWGTLLFNQKDLWEHNGKVKEKSFLKLLPDAIEDFMDLMKVSVSQNIMSGAKVATATANGDASGNITVDRPDRLVIGQKLQVDDDNSAPLTVYIRTIDINTKVVTCYDARTGGAVVDLSGYTVAQNAALYLDNAQANSFTSLKSALLSAANGGTSTLYGQSKVAYPYLQSINILGSSISASNILDKLFDAVTTHRILGKGKPDTFVMSYKHLGSVLKILETSKGAFNIVPNSQKVNVYGYTEITLWSVKGGELVLVGVQEMDDDVIFGIDWRALKFHSNGLFMKRTAPDGKEYFEVRATTGYSYLVDIALFGELILSRPSYCFIIHSISY